MATKFVQFLPKIGEKLVNKSLQDGLRL